MKDISISFKGKKAHTVSSSSYVNRLHEIRREVFPEMEIVAHTSVRQMMSEVTNNSDAFAVVDLLYYLTSVKSGVPIKRHAVGDKSDDTFGVIMPLSNDWEPLIRDFFNSGYITSSEYRLMVTKHLGKSSLRLIEGWK